MHNTINHPPQILLRGQSLLDTPNAADPEQQEAYSLYMQNKEVYARRVKQQAAKYTP